MVLASLILSIAFICSMCILVIVSKGDEKSSSASVNSNDIKRPEIHIHNNNTNNSTTDNVSEDMIREELTQLRNDLIRKQQLDIEILEQLNRLDELTNKK